MGTTPSPPTQLHPPRVLPLPYHPRTRTTSAGEGATARANMAVLRSTKEILGVDNAQLNQGIAQAAARLT